MGPCCGVAVRTSTTPSSGPLIPPSRSTTSRLESGPQRGALPPLTSSEPSSLPSAWSPAGPAYLAARAGRDAIAFAIAAGSTGTFSARYRVETPFASVSALSTIARSRGSLGPTNTIPSRFPLSRSFITDA